MLMNFHHLSHRLYARKVPVLPQILKGVIYVLFHCVIPPQVEIGAGTKLWHHGLGIVFHPGTKIGKGCNIYNFVVIGGGHDGPGGPPVQITIGDNVNIGAGAKVLCTKGSLSIGSGSTIASNAVVLEDVTENVVVGGIPAKIIKNKHSSLGLRRS
jgi:serine O-acetyltransferase